MPAPLTSDDDPLVLPLPEDALLLADRAPAGATPRALAVLALQHHMAALGVSLPLGPTLALEDPERLLSLNGFRVQLTCAPYGADSLRADSVPWRRAGQAPHFLLAAWVEEDLGVVWMPGVLTNGEVIDQAAGGEGPFDLPLERFQGGVDRLLTLAGLLDPATMPLRGLDGRAPTRPSQGTLARHVSPLPIAPWTRGWIDGALLALGAKLQPVGGAVFRGSSAPASADGADLAILAIPLGLVNGALCWGEARVGAIERFQLQLIARGDAPARPNALRVRLVPHLAGDVLPNGLRLVAGPRAVVSAISQGLELEVRGNREPIQIAVEWGEDQLRLPPLLLPPSDPPEVLADPHADR